MISRNRIARALDRLEPQVAEVWGAWEQECARKVAERQRWKEVMSRFCYFIPDDLGDRVTAALQGGDRGLWGWIENIVRGRCRLPECLTQEVMRRLVLVRLDEADRCDSFEGVCLHCGLQYPMPKLPPWDGWRVVPGCPPGQPPRYEQPRLFDHDGCPACGASSKAGHMNWAHLMEDGHWFARKDA